MNKLTQGSILWIAFVSLLSLSLIPSVSGDGTPIYYQSNSANKGDPYAVTVEARQLASVTLLNDTHQRIDLFLSVYSFEPDRNMTIIVPFRTIPDGVDSDNTIDSNFLKEIRYDKIKDLSYEQSVDHAQDMMLKKAKKSIIAGAVSSDFGPLGLFALYLADNYHSASRKYIDEEGGKIGSSGGGDYDKGVIEIKRYDFEGTSVRVFSVGVNATLDSFLQGIDIVDPPSMTAEVLEDYKGHYALTIDCKTSPPIRNEDFRMLKDLIPNTLSELKNYTNTNVLEQSRIPKNARYYAQEGFREIIDSQRDIESLLELYECEVPAYERVKDWTDDYYKYPYKWYSYNWHPFDLYNHIIDLLNVIYGYSEMNGTVISVISSLEHGKIYFPLGTSKGWSRPISQTVIVLDVPKDLELEHNLPITYSAFINERRYYLFEYLDANPKDDIVGTILPSDGEAERRAELGTTLHAVVPLVGILGFGAQIVLLFLCLIFASVAIRMRDGESFRVFSLNNVLLTISTFVISGPLTYYFFIHCKRREKGSYRNVRDGYLLAMLIFYVINIGIIAGMVIP